MSDNENINASSVEDAKQNIRSALKNGRFGDADDLVDVSEGVDHDIHVVVVSRKFDGRRLKEKTDMIWSELEKLGQAVWSKVSLAIGVSPEEIKAT